MHLKYFSLSIVVIISFLLSACEPPYYFIYINDTTEPNAIDSMRLSLVRASPWWSDGHKLVFLEVEGTNLKEKDSSILKASQWIVRSTSDTFDLVSPNDKRVAGQYGLRNEVTVKAHDSQRANLLFESRTKKTRRQFKKELTTDTIVVQPHGTNTKYVMIGRVTKKWIWQKR